jgi:5-oxoprolinase (ATP-hydrolysing) subunit A
MLINADLGEGCPNDEALFELVDLGNIACGGHAGDIASMTRACELSLRHGVQLGAHPSYPDREGFGRRRPPGTLSNLLGELTRQVERFEEVALAMGCVTSHLKPHGQLYNDAAAQEDVAELIIELARQFPHLKLLALAGSPQVLRSRQAGLSVLEEAFPDRRYQSDGFLVPRAAAGAVIEEVETVGKQATAFITGVPIDCQGGSKRRIAAQTLCVHGDSPFALNNARAVRQALNVSKP